MKSLRTILSIVLVLCMVLGMSVVGAFAADPEASVKVSVNGTDVATVIDDGSSYMVTLKECPDFSGGEEISVSVENVISLAAANDSSITISAEEVSSVNRAVLGWNLLISNLHSYDYATVKLIGNETKTAVFTITDKAVTGSVTLTAQSGAVVALKEIFNSAIAFYEDHSLTERTQLSDIIKATNGYLTINGANTISAVDDELSDFVKNNETSISCTLKESAPLHYDHVRIDVTDGLTAELTLSKSSSGGGGGSVPPAPPAPSTDDETVLTPSDNEPSFSAEVIEEALADVSTGEKTDLVIDASNLTGTTFNITMDALSSDALAKVDTVVIQTPIGDIVLEPAELGDKKVVIKVDKVDKVEGMETGEDTPIFKVAVLDASTNEAVDGVKNVGITLKNLDNKGASVKVNQYDDSTLELKGTYYGKVNEDGEIVVYVKNGLSYFVVEADNAAGFTDVYNTDWFYEAVSYVAGKGFMNGTADTLFTPNGTTTRAQMVTTLYRMAGSPAVTTDAGFTDLTADWYKDAVNWAFEKGVTTGITETTFAPDNNVSREQLVTFFYRYAKMNDATITADTSKLAAFTDAADVSDYATEAFAWAVDKGIVTGMTDTTLVPQGTATRAQLATILMRFDKAF